MVDRSLAERQERDSSHSGLESKKSMDYSNLWFNIAL